MLLLFISAGKNILRPQKRADSQRFKQSKSDDQNDSAYKTCESDTTDSSHGSISYLVLDTNELPIEPIDSYPKLKELNDRLGRDPEYRTQFVRYWYWLRPNNKTTKTNTVFHIIFIFLWFQKNALLTIIKPVDRILPIVQILLRLITREHLSTYTYINKVEGKMQIRSFNHLVETIFEVWEKITSSSKKLKFYSQLQQKMNHLNFAYKRWVILKNFGYHVFKMCIQICFRAAKNIKRLDSAGESIGSMSGDSIWSNRFPENNRKWTIVNARHNHKWQLKDANNLLFPHLSIYLSRKMYSKKYS